MRSSSAWRGALIGAVHGLGCLGAAMAVVVSLVLGFRLPEATADLLSPEWNREFGLIEGLQASLLAGMAALLLLARDGWRRLLGVLALVALLEELDYFLHVWDWVVHGETYRTHLGGYRNVHNRPGIDRLSRAGHHLGILGLVGLTCFRVVRPAPADPLLPMRRATAGIGLAALVAFGAAFTMWGAPPYTPRQVFNETLELTLYSVLALVVCEDARSRWLLRRSLSAARR